MKTIKLSATAIQAYKACPYRYFLKYVKRIERAEDQDALRMGTNWHALLEILSIPSDDPMAAAVEYMDKAYENMPGTKTKEEWEVEKVTLLYSASAYRWYYANDDIEVLERELRFEIPVPNLTTGRAIQNFRVPGVIDKIVNYKGTRCVMEHKSTSKSLDPDSTYWGRLNLDTQTTLYPFATNLIDGIEPINGVLYDVFRKPSISPKKLTQGDSKKFVETGEYCGQKFTVEWQMDNQDLMVGETLAEVIPGAKEGTFAIRETPEMFGARLLEDIASRPEHYFARRIIARTDDDINRFHKQLIGLHSNIKFNLKNDSFVQNEDSCEATFRCNYCDICYNNMDPDGELPETLIRKGQTDGPKKD